MNNENEQPKVPQGVCSTELVGHQCTWVGCTDKACHMLCDKHGKIWARLCDKHYQQHDVSVTNAVRQGGKDNIRKMLGAWVKSGGGAEKMSKRVMPNTGAD